MFADVFFSSQQFSFALKSISQNEKNPVHNLFENRVLTGK